MSIAGFDNLKKVLTSIFTPPPSSSSMVATSTSSNSNNNNKRNKQPFKASFLVRVGRFIHQSTSYYSDRPHSSCYHRSLSTAETASQRTTRWFFFVTWQHDQQQLPCPLHCPGPGVFLPMAIASACTHIRSIRQVRFVWDPC